MSSTKKKVIISLSSVIAVLLIAACAFVAVFAARNATVNSAFNITYTANHVEATITGSYKIGASGTDTTITANDGAATSISFAGTEETGSADATKSFDEITGIALTEEDDYVTFTYIITNNGSNAISVGLTTTMTADNVNVEYKVGDTTITYEDGVNLGSVASGTTGNTMTITIKISIDDADDNVSISDGNFAFTLN